MVDNNNPNKTKKEKSELSTGVCTQSQRKIDNNRSHVSDKVLPSEGPCQENKQLNENVPVENAPAVDILTDNVQEQVPLMGDKVQEQVPVMGDAVKEQLQVIDDHQDETIDTPQGEILPESDNKSFEDAVEECKAEIKEDLELVEES